MNVCCILPYSYSKNRNMNVTDVIIHTGLLEIISALKNEGNNVLLLDFLSEEKHEGEELNEKLSEFKPDIICINTYVCFEDYLWLIHLLDNEYLLKPHILIGVGALAYEYVFNHVDTIDYIVPSFPEVIVPKLVRHLDNGYEHRSNLPAGVAYKRNNKVIFDTHDELNSDDVFPRTPIGYYISKEDKRQAYLWTSKGCWHGKCTYCTVGAAYTFPNKWIPRSLSDVKSEIDEVFSHGVRNIAFLDDQFIGQGEKGYQRAMELAAYIGKYNINFSIRTRLNSFDEQCLDALIDAGLTCMFVGLESCSDNILRRIKKGYFYQQALDQWNMMLRKKLEIIPGIILADPFTTNEDLIEHFTRIKEIYKDHTEKIYIDSLFHELHLHRGTFIFDEVYKSNGDILFSEMDCLYYAPQLQKSIRLCRHLHDGINSLLKEIRNTDNATTLYNHVSYLIKARIFDIILDILRQTNNDENLTKKSIDSSINGIRNKWLLRLNKPDEQ
jgi:radical SAM superfamily enzyme YgiQ (UPF0313 family)